MYGEEIKAYARKHGMIAPVEECNRCWRLRYADEENFHLDTLPCVPEEAVVIAKLMTAEVPEEFLCLTGMKKRVANKHPCPCGSGRRLGRCHCRRVNHLRRTIGRTWFQAEYQRVASLLEDMKES